MLFFLANHKISGIGFCLVSLFRLFRGFLGFYIYRYLPDTKVIAKTTVPPSDEGLDYVKVEKNVPKAIEKSLEEHYQQVERPLLIYTITSAVCLVIDLLSTLIIIIMASLQDAKLVYLAMLLIVTAYFYMDTWLIWYALLTRFKMPLAWQTPVLKACFGAGSDLILKLDGEPKGSRSSGK